MDKCVMCGKELLLPQQSHKIFDNVGRMCPRCGAVYCVFCLKKLPEHSDGSASQCKKCGKFTIFEVTGKPQSQIERLAKQNADRYGTQKTSNMSGSQKKPFYKFW